MNAINDHSISTGNRLLHMELAAIESYTQVIDKYDGKPASQLERIRNEHFASAERIREEIRDLGGVPDEGFSLTELYMKAVQGIANLFGPDSAIDALQRAEEGAREDYEETLKDPKLPSEFHSMVRHELLRRVHRYIAALELLSHEGM